MIFVHKESNGSEQNPERHILIKLNNAFVLKKEEDILETDDTNVDHFEYLIWLEKGNTPQEIN